MCGAEEQGKQQWTAAGKSQSVVFALKGEEGRVRGPLSLAPAFKRRGQLRTLAAVGQVMRCW